MELQLALAVLTAVAMVIVSLLTVTLRDLVYSSIMLATLGLLTAAMVALLGYYIVAAFIIIVYVGAAVMFIIISVSMLGGGGFETRNTARGLLAALATLVALAAALGALGLPHTSLPVSVDPRAVGDSLTGGFLAALLVLLAALAATVIEGIAVARRG